MRDAGIPTPDFYAFTETAFRELGAARALPAIEARLDFPIVVKPAGQGSALGIKFAATAADVPGALVAAFSYDTKVLLERHVAGRDLAVSVLEGPDGPEALPLVEAIPRDEDFYDFEARYEIGRTDFRCPAEVGDETTLRAQELAVAAYRLLGCYGFARIDLMLDGRDRRARGPRGQRDPRPDRDVAAPAGRRGRGDLLRRADRASAGSRGARRASARRSRASTAPRRPGSPRARPGRGTP